MSDNVRGQAEPSQELIDCVIERMKKDIAEGDWTAIDELLTFVPHEFLVGYLDEEEWKKWGYDGVCENCAGPAHYHSDVILCVECEESLKVLDKHGVNCYFCNALVDERECMPADDWNCDDGGDICPACQKRCKKVLREGDEGFGEGV